MDANGDGVGDFEELMRRLDYLAGIGVTALWLMPFQPSPHRDDGYDTQDYYGVDPRYGTLGDFVEFTQHARARGIRVIVDLVINHTSVPQNDYTVMASVHRTWPAYSVDNLLLLWARRARVERAQRASLWHHQT